MMKNVVNTRSFGNMPEWYWRRGLHDACILCKKYVNRSEISKNHRITNALELTIDSTQAMFDTSVSAIRFFNYKELTPNINLLNSWWVSDRLSYHDGKYILEISLRLMNCSIRYDIRFEHCEVVRNMV